MPLEIEAKLKVDSHDAVRAGILRAGGQFVSCVTEVNAILDTPDRRLLNAGCGLRVRTCEGEGEVPPATLTYKGPQQTHALKVRDELETPVGDAEATLAILSALGFAPVITFEKRRETWKLHGAKVELDKVPRLGCYVEIEAPDEPTIQRVRAAIGLAGQPSIRSSYIALLVEHASSRGLPADRITFG